jgi:hypothetical protein
MFGFSIQSECVSGALRMNFAAVAKVETSSARLRVPICAQPAAARLVLRKWRRFIEAED